MAKLIINPNSITRREVELPRSLLCIGRDPSNDLVLPDAMVSRHHAVVERRSIGLAAIGAGMGVAHGVFYPAFNAVALDEAGARERGKVMALFQAAFNVGASAGAVGFGLLAARAGYPAVFQTAAGCLFVALLLLMASPEGRRSD